MYNPSKLPSSADCGQDVKRPLCYLLRLQVLFQAHESRNSFPIPPTAAHPLESAQTNRVCLRLTAANMGGGRIDAYVDIGSLLHDELSHGSQADLCSVNSVHLYLHRLSGLAE